MPQPNPHAIPPLPTKHEVEENIKFILPHMYVCLSITLHSTVHLHNSSYSFQCSGL